MERILAAVDTSEIAPLVVARATELAKRFNGKVRLVRAVPVEPLPPLPGVIAPTPLADAVHLLGPAEKAVSELLEAVPEELRDGTVVEIGSPAEVVCSCARADDADIVVIGAHRYGSLARVLGSNASRIVNRIDRPVFVVRTVPSKAVARDTPDMISAAEILQRDHERLDRSYGALLDAFHRRDWSEIRARWETFEPALLAHMEIEEEQVFPAFRAVDRTEAKALRLEHKHLRRLVALLGVGIELHLVSDERANELIARLRAHAVREEQLLYPWLDEHGLESGSKASLHGGATDEVSPRVSRH